MRVHTSGYSDKAANPIGFKATKVKAKRRGGFIKTFLIGFIIFVALLVPAMYWISMLAEKPIAGGDEILPDGLKEANLDPNDPNYDMFMNTERLNMLLLGINGHLTDTIMLGSYDMKNQRLDIISVPRDTYYDRPEAKSAAQRKINAIYGSDGAVGTAAAVQDILGGIPIHYYAVIKFEGVAEVVDSIGGVTVDIPIDMNYDDPYDKPPLHIHFTKGEQTLNGEDAVKFLRFRKNNNGGGYPNQDIGRTAAQREFMKAAFKEALGFNLPNVVKTVMNNVDSDLTVGVAGKIAVKAAGLDAANVQGYSLEGKSGTVNGASYWFVDETAAEALIGDIYNPPPPEDAQETENPAEHTAVQ
ncbi:MAG: LCP family protein [Clostridiales Family XIII bacterium]|jgi:LCP family protein required for cell wall assembly|nr:LCP family protein [Clostridiales Family XIII bacterium]